MTSVPTTRSARWASTSRRPSRTAPSSRPSRPTTPTAPSGTCPAWSGSSRPARLVIKRETVEARLGREWETHEFQLAIISYFGHIKEWDDDEIVIAWDH